MSYVQIIKTLIEAKDRTAKIPGDTMECPFQMLVKGQVIGNDHGITLISTHTGRTESGHVHQSNPSYEHTFGDFVAELITMRSAILNEMWHEDD